MRYGSVCSGVEAASLAWMPLDWECKFVSEIEPFPCAVLQQRFGASAPINVLDPNDIIITDEEQKEIAKLKEKFGKYWGKECSPDLIGRIEERNNRISWIKQYEQLNKEGVIPNEGDFTKIGKKYAGQIDLLVGGTPCQDLSIAGKRAGFDGERSSLAIDFVRLAYESQCKWFIWENVPGVFSSNHGRDFATLLSLFTGCKVEVPEDGFRSAGFVCNTRSDRYGVAWRVLDAQFTRVPGFPFGVPQRRRRVFVVGYFGDWVRAAQVLLEQSRLSWNTPSRFKARERFAGFAGQDLAVASREFCNSATNGGELLAQGGVKGLDCYNQNLTDDVSMTATSKREDPHHVTCAVQSLRMRAGKEGGGKGALIQTELSGTLQTGNDQAIATFWNGRDVAETETKTLDTYHLNSAEDGSCLKRKARDYKDPQIVCLNDQGGSVMAVEENGNAGTLRANTHGNEQIVCYENQGGNVIVAGFDQYNMDETGDVTSSLGTNCGMSTGRQSATVVHGAETPINNSEHANPLTCNHNGLENCVAIGFEPGIAKRDGSDSRFTEEFAGTLRSNAGDNQHAVAIAENIIGRQVENGGNGVEAQEELAYTQNASGVMGVCNSTVRRLIPVECERLMGFPDNHTRIAWNGKSPEDCPDAPRYKACGNSFCVNVVRWIGMQIDRVERMESVDNEHLCT